MGVATTYNPGSTAVRPPAAGEPESPLLPSSFARFTAILLAAVARGSAGILGRPAARDNLALRIRARRRSSRRCATRRRPARRRPPAHRARRRAAAPAHRRRVPRRTSRSSCRSPRRPSAAWPTRCARASSRPREVAGRNAPARARLSATDRRRPAPCSSLPAGAARRRACSSWRASRATAPRGSPAATARASRRSSLNQPQDPRLPARMYSISLSAEQEARQVALHGDERRLARRRSSSPRPRRSRGAWRRPSSANGRRAAGEVAPRRLLRQARTTRPLIKERIAALTRRHGLPRPRRGRHARRAPVHLRARCRSTPPRSASTRAPSPRSTWTWRVCVMWTCPGSSSPTIPP